MAYTFTITEVFNQVTATVSSNNIAVTVDNSLYTVTNQIRVFTATQVLNTVTLYTNGIELRVDDFGNYFKGTWVSGTTYQRGDIVDDNYSLYVSSIQTGTTILSTLSPHTDPNHWRRVVWNEAPRDHLTVTNTLNVGLDLTVGGVATINELILTKPMAHITATNALFTTLNVTSTAEFHQDVIVDRDLDVNGNATVTGFLTVDDYLTVNGVATAERLDTPEINVDQISSDVTSFVQINSPLKINNETTVTSNFNVIGSESISQNLTVSGQTNIGSTRVSGKFTATGAVQFDNTLNVSGTATLASLSVGSITANSAVTINAPTTINNTLTVTKVNATSITSNILSANTLTTVFDLISNGKFIVNSTATINGIATFTAQPNFQAGITATIVTTDDLTVNGQLILDGLAYPRNKGEYGQVLFTNGTTATAWVNLGDLVYWNLSDDLLTNGYNIRSGTIAHNVSYYNATTGDTQIIPVYQPMAIGKGGPSQFNADFDTTLTNAIIFSNLPFDAYNHLTSYKNQLEVRSSGDVIIHADPGLGPDWNGTAPGNVTINATSGTVNINATELLFNGEAFNPGLGYTGSRGYAGSQGPAGGYTGSAGTNGYTGSRGADGTPGGPIGYTGSRGADGGSYTLPEATLTTLGGVKVDVNNVVDFGITVNEVHQLKLKPATTYSIGGIMVGDYLSINGTSNALSVNTATLFSAYQIPSATTSTIGGVVVGSGLAINTSTGVLSLDTSTVSFGHISFTATSVTIEGTGTINLSAAEVHVGLDNYRSKMFVERIEAFDGAGSVFFPGGVRYPDNTIQVTAYPGNFGVLGSGSTFQPFQMLRGSTAQVHAYTPAIGEIVMSTSTKQVFVGDGVTAGGIPIAGTTNNNFDFGSIV